MFIVSALVFPAIYLACRWKKRLEETLVPALLVAMLVVTGLAMVGKLQCLDSLVIAVTLLTLVCGAVHLALHLKPLKMLVKDTFTYVLTPGLLCFCAAVLFFWFAAEPMVVWWRDDLVHWGLQVKSLWFFHGLVDGAHSLNARFGDYPPGIQVLQWLMIHAEGTWSERTLYFILFTTYAVFLLPLFSRVPWRRAYWMPLMLLFLIAFPTWGNVLSYVFLGVDTSLSLCFGYALLLAWEHRRGERFTYAAFALALCGMLAIKQIGLLLAVFALVLFTLRTHEKAKRLISLWALPLLLTGAWAWYCNAMGLSGYNTSGISTQLAAMIAGRYQLPANADGILPALWNALLHKYTGDITLYTAAPVELPLLFWFLALALLPLLLRAQKKLDTKSAKLATVWMLATAAIYLTAIYGSFFTTFYYETDVYTYGEQENMVLLIERYMTPLILGFAMLVIRLLQNAFSAPVLMRESASSAGKKNPSLPITVLAFSVLIAISTNWAVMEEVLNPDRYYQNERSIGSENAVRDQETWGSALDGIPDARVMIDLDATSDYTKELMYSFAPARFYLSTADNTASTEALSAYLTQQGITQLICLADDSALMQCAAPLAPDQTLYSYTLYNVLSGANAISLEENND